MESEDSSQFPLQTKQGDLPGHGCFVNSPKVTIDPADDIRVLKSSDMLEHVLNLEANIMDVSSNIQKKDSKNCESPTFSSKHLTLNRIFVSMAHMLRSLHDFVVDSQEIWPFQGFESLDATKSLVGWRDGYLNMMPEKGNHISSTQVLHRCFLKGPLYIGPDRGIFGRPRRYPQTFSKNSFWRFYMDSICLYWQCKHDGTWV